MIDIRSPIDMVFLSSANRLDLAPWPPESERFSAGFIGKTAAAN